MNWQKVVTGLKKLVDDIGAFWPSSTPLAGYAEDGPYHCEDCKWLKGKIEGKIFVDANGKGRCPHPVMLADAKTRKDKDGVAIVHINKGCCEFVDQIPDKPGEPEGLVQIAGVKGNMERKHPFSHTVIEHHGDNTHTVHHIHQDNKFAGTPMLPGKGDIRSAAGSHDEMMDRIMDNTSDANEGEDMDAD